MKNIIILTILMSLSVVSQAQKKLKLGFNTGMISPKALFETEARDGTKFFIDSADGKVGIGTTAPATTLQINNPLQATNTVNAAAQVLQLSRPILPSFKNPNIAQFNLGSYSASSANALTRLDLALNDVGPSPLTTVMTWQANGNVGIGVTAPNSKLVVSGGDQITGNLDTRSNTDLNVSSIGGAVGSGGSLIFSANNGLWNFAGIKGLVASGGGNSVGHLAFSLRNVIADTALTERMRILSNGKVGIGTSSPISTLDVLGSFGANQISTSAPTYTFTDADFAVRLTLLASQSINLPTIGFNQRRIIVVINPTAFDKVFANNAYQDLSGGFSFTIPANSSLTLQNIDGSGWALISKDLQPLIVSTSYPAVANVTPTGITPATAVDYMSINLPSAGTWEINWAVRGVTNSSVNTGISSVLTTSANVVQPNSEVLSVYVQSGALNSHATGRGSYIVTVSAATTYKIRVYAVATVSTAFATSDANGRSWVSAKRIQ